MGVFDVKTVSQPELCSCSGLPEGIIEIQAQSFTIRVRVAVTEEDEHFILNRYLNAIMHERKMSIDKQLKLLDSLWLERLLVSWDLPIPLENKAKAIARLSRSDRDFLYQQIKAAQPEKPLRRRQLGSQKSLPPDIKEAVEKRQSRGNMVQLEQ